jgi:glutamate dehydrogenase/leucine dehydrogenase
VGSNQRLIHAMYRHVGVDIPAPSQEIDNAGSYTALGVMRSVEIGLELKGMALRACTFAVEGFGHVGSHLARLLHARGARVVALSSAAGAIYDPEGLPVPELFERRGVDGLGTPSRATRLSREELPELDVDVICPCARDATVHSGNVERVRASIVCAGANNPVTLPADERLHRRGILYLPDFMTNAGGALGNMVRFAGLSDRYFHRLIAGEFTSKIVEVFRASEARSSTPREAGIRWAEEKFARMKAGKERRSGSNALFELALSIYRRGVVPPVLVRPLTFRHMRALIAS